MRCLTDEERKYGIRCLIKMRLAIRGLPDGHERLFIVTAMTNRLNRLFDLRKARVTVRESPLFARSNCAMIAGS